MTTWPRLRLGKHLLPGLLAVALFVVFAAVFLNAGLEGGAGFEAGVSITASIGYAMMDLAGGEVESNGFLAAFIIVAFVLDAALDGSVMLAKREDEHTFGTALETGGTRQVVEERAVDPAETAAEPTEADRGAARTDEGGDR